MWAGAGGEGSWRGLTCGKAVKDYRWQHGPHGGCGLSPREASWTEMPRACLVSRAGVRSTSLMLTLDLSLLGFKPALSRLMLSRNGEE